VQLSRANEFYPGSPESQDRILLISGTVNQLLTALHLVLSKLKAEPGALRAVQAKEGEAIALRMLVHSRLCGTLIGKGGATIRSFNEDSHAVFNISPPPAMPGESRPAHARPRGCCRQHILQSAAGKQACQVLPNRTRTPFWASAC
jgi:hypothetical protein